MFSGELKFTFSRTHFSSLKFNQYQHHSDTHDFTLKQFYNSMKYNNVMTKQTMANKACTPNIAEVRKKKYSPKHNSLYSNTIKQKKPTNMTVFPSTFQAFWQLRNEVSTLWVIQAWLSSCLL